MAETIITQFRHLVVDFDIDAKDLGQFVLSQLF